MPKRSAESYHDRVASKYDAMFEGDPYWEYYDTITWEHIKTHLPRDQMAPLVDLGCGTGKWGLKLARSGYAVTLVDLSARMLDQAREAAAGVSWPVDRAPRFVKADLADLSELPRDHFALAVAQGDPLSHCENPPRAVKEIAAILRPGGVLVASVDNRAAGLWYYLERGALDELESFVRSGRTHWLTADRNEQFPIKTFWPDELRELMSRAGLEVLELLGKTALDLRRHPKLLAAAREDSSVRRRLLKLERTLQSEPGVLGLASHLEVIARRRT